MPLEASFIRDRGAARGPFISVERAPLERRAEARVAGLALVICQLRRLFLGTLASLYCCVGRGRDEHLGPLDVARRRRA